MSCGAATAAASADARKTQGRHDAVGDAQRARHRDHRAVVGAVLRLRKEHASAARARRASTSARAARGWRPRRRRRPASTARSRPSACSDFATSTSTTAAWNACAMSALRASASCAGSPPSLAARARQRNRRLEAGKRNVEIAGVEHRPRQRDARPACPASASARAPARPDTAARAASRSCRTPRRPRRRACRRAAGSGRRRAPRRAACGRPTRAARRTETRRRRSPSSGDSRWPSRWWTPITGLPSAKPSALATLAPTSSAPASPGPCV